MKFRKHGLTENDLSSFRELGLSDSAIVARLRKFKGDIKKALSYPKMQGKKNQLENQGKARSTRLPLSIDEKLIEYAEKNNITISDAIARAVIKFLG